jgi:tetratricopeptide (TPR) repeat protein
MRANKGLRLLAAVLAIGGADALAQAPSPAQSPPIDQRAVARAQELEALKQPTKAAPKVRAALAYESTGDVQAARTAANEALGREANNVEAMQVLARLETREENWGEGVAHLRRAAQLEPNNAATQLALGQALEKLGDQAESDAAYAAYRSLQGMKPLQPRDQAKR